MHPNPLKVVIFATLVAVCCGPRTGIANDDGKVIAGSCSVAAGSAASNNTLNCNFGLTPEQLRQLTKAAVEGATEPLLGQIVNISKQLGVTEDAAKTLLRVVGKQVDLPDEKLAEQLIKVAANYGRLQAQVAALNPNNTTARDLIEGAKMEIRDGHFAEAYAMLSQATETQIAAARQAGVLSDQAQAAAHAQLLGAAASTAAEGDLAITELDYQKAAALFKQAVDLVPAGQAATSFNYLNRYVNALYRQGDEHGDNSALKQVIGILQTIALHLPRDRAPLKWARTQNALGLALMKLGERESDSTDLQNAIAAFRAAQEMTRDRAPLDWAETQNDLGTALENLGERETDNTDLQGAVIVYRAAL